jgi:hypothetical protein
MTVVSPEQWIQELKKFVASLEQARVAAEDYDDPRAIKQLEKMCPRAVETGGDRAEQLALEGSRDHSAA